MRVHSILHGTRANGPGLRSCVWVQGCVGLSCPGCQNPKTHPPFGGYAITPEELACRIIRESATGTTGVTISGGEPLQQGRSVYDFMCMIQALRPNWDIGLFTGYTMTELLLGHYDLRDSLPNLGTIEHARACLWEYQISDRIAWAVFGRYDYTRPTLDYQPYHRLCSSANQHLYIFRGPWGYDDFAPAICEMSIGPDGLTQISGFPPLKQPTGE